MVTAEQLSEWARAQGMRSAAIGMEGIDEAREGLVGLEAEGSLDAGFVRRSLRGFKYLEECRVVEPRSLILMALPRPAHTVSFQMEDGVRELVLPPTYVWYRPTFDRICSRMRADLGLSPRELDLASVPLKSLAARSGLTRYGRNNIGYVPGWGSYVQLVALASSFPLDCPGERPDIESRRLDRCGECRACVKACPTGAISVDRFLLHTERCYVLFSESLDPIPDSMPIPSPRCLVGCLRCQEVCPENKGLLTYERTDAAFSRLETEAMLNDPLERDAAAWKSIRDKFGLLGLSEDAPLYARNLRLIVARARKTH